MMIAAMISPSLLDDLIRSLRERLALLAATSLVYDVNCMFREHAAEQLTDTCAEFNLLDNYLLCSRAPCISSHTVDSLAGANAFIDDMGKNSEERLGETSKASENREKRLAGKIRVISAAAGKRVGRISEIVARRPSPRGCNAT